MNRIRRSIDIPEELYKKIEAMAEAEVRSINGQIVYLLDDIVSRREARVKPYVYPKSEAKE
jgi:hypothetical protein